MTTWACGRRLKYGEGRSRRTEPRSPWDLAPFPGGRCPDGVELQDTQLVSGTRQNRVPAPRAPHPCSLAALPPSSDSFMSRPLRWRAGQPSSPLGSGESVKHFRSHLVHTSYLALESVIASKGYIFSPGDCGPRGHSREGRRMSKGGRVCSADCSRSEP